MPKTSLPLFLILIVATIAVVSIMPGDADAMPFDGRCFCGMTSTGSFTGTSSTDCYWAKMDALQQANVCGTDGTCEFTILFDENGCTPDGPAYWEYDITARVSCNICF